MAIKLRNSNRINAGILLSISGIFVIFACVVSLLYIFKHAYHGHVVPYYPFLAVINLIGIEVGIFFIMTASSLMKKTRHVSFLVKSIPDRSFMSLNLTSITTIPKTVDLSKITQTPESNKDPLTVFPTPILACYNCLMYFYNSDLSLNLPSINFHPPSKLFMYINTLLQMKQDIDDVSYNVASEPQDQPNLIQTVRSDMTIDQVCLAIQRFGLCTEEDWPMNPSITINTITDKIYTLPTIECYATALHNRVIVNTLMPQNNLHVMQTTLTAGVPFICGVFVFDSYFGTNDRTPLVPMPLTNEKSVSSMAVLVMGFDDTSRLFKVQSFLGDIELEGNGYLYFPYDYLTNTKYCFNQITMRLKCTLINTEELENNESQMCF
uniref:Uncharacterized protein n=1 Tax=viral metagenome TaxID=1070528 RepID=A0A6C0CRQ0_9ZZZZ